MFHVALRLPPDSEYAELGIGPEADKVEIVEAHAELHARVQREKNDVNERLAKLFEQVPGLKAALDEVKTLREQSEHAGEAGADALLKREQELARLETQALRFDSGYRELLVQAARMAQREQTINDMAVLKADGRETYDQGRPPLALFKLADCTQDEFATDDSITLWLVRSELNRFFVERGEEPFHPSDLTREDFARDFTYRPLLDG